MSEFFLLQIQTLQIDIVDFAYNSRWIGEYIEYECHIICNMKKRNAYCTFSLEKLWQSLTKHKNNKDIRI